MKALTIKEPYVTLIKTGIKTIETRSWKTNYRGKILVHSSKAKYPIKDSIKHLINNELEYGTIQCIAELVDCIYMDEDFINKQKELDYNNYICGKYEVGRYAWVLKNIISLKQSIPYKGQLGIWNYNDKIDINN